MVPARSRVGKMQALVEKTGLGQAQWLDWSTKQMILMSMLEDANSIDEMLTLVEPVHDGHQLQKAASADRRCQQTVLARGPEASISLSASR